MTTNALEARKLHAAAAVLKLGISWNDVKIGSCECHDSCQVT